MGCPESNKDNVSGTNQAGTGKLHGPHPGITCKQLCEFLYDFVEGDLPSESRNSFEAHLKECPPCEQYLRQYEHTIRMTKRCMCPGVEKPPPLPDDMVNAIIAAIMSPSERST